MWRKNILECIYSIVNYIASNPNMKDPNIIKTGHTMSQLKNTAQVDFNEKSMRKDALYSYVESHVL